MNEATYLWGVYVEGELREAGESGKNKRQAAVKVQARSNQILNPPDKKFPKYEEQKAVPKPKGTFRDPASMFRK